MLFRLLLLGEDFPVKVDGEKALMGWYKTVWVEAADQSEAKSKALDAVGAELLEAGIETIEGSRISWDEIDEFDSGKEPEAISGFTLFEMEN